MVEKHVRDQIAQQMDYYVDAYNHYDRLSRQAVALQEQLSAVEQEMAQVAQLRDHAAEAVNGLVSDYEEPGDVAVIDAIVKEKMVGVIGTMVTA